MKKPESESRDHKQGWTTRNKNYLENYTSQNMSKSLHSKEEKLADNLCKAPFQVGPLEGSFVVESEHCRGGYGAVYKGHAMGDQSQKVAIKAFFPNHRPYYALQEILYMLLLEPYEGFTKLRGVYTHNSYIFLVKSSLLGHGLG